MKENFSKKYKDERSESFSSENEGFAIPSVPNKAPQSPSRGEILSSRRPRRQGEPEIAPYTFDPRQFLESLDKPAPTPTPKSIPANKPLEKESIEKSSPAKQNANSMVSRHPKETPIAVEPVPNHPIPNADIFQYKSARNAENNRAVGLRSSPEESLGDSRAENEYRTYAREFDSEFGDHEREIAALSKQLVARIKKLQVFERELNNPNLEVAPLRNKLARDIESIEDELGEANHNIIVLMNERKNIKERFCTIRVKYNEMNNYNRACQEKMRR